MIQSLAHKALSTTMKHACACHLFSVVEPVRQDKDSTHASPVSVLTNRLSTIYTHVSLRQNQSQITVTTSIRLTDHTGLDHPIDLSLSTVQNGSQRSTDHNGSKISTDHKYLNGLKKSKDLRCLQWVIDLNGFKMSSDLRDHRSSKDLRCLLWVIDLIGYKKNTDLRDHRSSQDLNGLLQGKDHRCLQ